MLCIFTYTYLPNPVFIKDRASVHGTHALPNELLGCPK